MKKYGFINIFALIMASLFIACGVILISTYMYTTNANGSDREKSSINESIHNFRCMTKYALRKYSSTIKKNIVMRYPQYNVMDKCKRFNGDFLASKSALTWQLKELMPQNIVDEYKNKGVSFNISINKTTLTEEMCKLDITLNIDYKHELINNRVIFRINPFFSDEDKETQVEERSIE